MIGNFLFVPQPRPDDVTVWLERGHGDAANTARLLLPARLAAMMAAQAYPPPAPNMSIDSALSYAVFLSMRSGAPLTISGDIACWDSEWGSLTDLGRFPSAGLVRQPSSTP